MEGKIAQKSKKNCNKKAKFEKIDTKMHEAWRKNLVKNGGNLFLKNFREKGEGWNCNKNAKLKKIGIKILH